MDNSDLAAAALKPDLRAKCNCRKQTKMGKPNKTCPKCHGTGTVTACKDCEASGWSRVQNKICPKCAGTGHT
jgi:DnaJ-class molecular chaperone